MRLNEFYVKDDCYIWIPEPEWHPTNDSNVFAGYSVSLTQPVKQGHFHAKDLEQPVEYDRLPSYIRNLLNKHNTAETRGE